MAIGTYRQIVTLDETDGAGGVRPLDPPTWYCAPIAEGGGLLTLVGPFHVDGVLHRDAKAFQTQITCKEVFE